MINDIENELKDFRYKLNLEQSSFLEFLNKFFSSIDSKILSDKSILSLKYDTLEIYLEHAEEIKTHILFKIRSQSFEIYCNNYNEINSFDNFNLNKYFYSKVLEALFKGKYKNIDTFHKGNLLKSVMFWEENLLPPITVYQSLYKRLFIQFIKNAEYTIKEENFKSFM